MLKNVLLLLLLLLTLLLLVVSFLVCNFMLTANSIILFVFYLSVKLSRMFSITAYTVLNHILLYLCSICKVTDSSVLRRAVSSVEFYSCLPRPGLTLCVQPWSNDSHNVLSCFQLDWEGKVFCLLRYLKFLARKFYLTI